MSVSGMDFVRNFGVRGDAPALLFPRRAPISYVELERRVAAVARSLGPDKRLVAVEAERSEHAIVAYLAALRAGHAVALLPPGDHHVLEQFTHDFRPDFLCRRADGRWRMIETGASAGDIHPDLALLLGTSGSTGKSRYVRLSAGALIANASAIAQLLGLTADDRAALVLPLHYSYGLSVLNSHLSVGAGVHVAAASVAKAGFAREIGDAGCTNLAGVPYSYELMERTGFLDADLPRLRFMTVAGGRIDPRLADKFRRRLAAGGKRLFLMYGQTEATARIAYVPPESLAGNLDSIGIAVPGGELRLLDADGSPVEAAGEAGELAYRGPNVMMGYAERRADLARGNEIEELRTGDMATRDAHGFFRIVGRGKRFSKIAGLRINHAGIEHALAAQGIEAAIVGDDRRLVAAIASSQPQRPVREVIAAASGLSALHVEVRKLVTLPRLASGKIDYQRIKQLAAQREPQPGQTVIDAFRRAFYPKRVVPTDSFETLGGDSLRYVQMSLTLERALGRVPEGWERMSIADLARSERDERGWQALDSDVVLRTAAILLVVVHHATLWPIPGGAATLVMLVGYGLARFQAANLFAGRLLPVFGAMSQNLAVYLPIVAGFALARGEVPWASLFLVGNLGFADPAGMLPYLYWFVEAYAQIILAWAALFALPWPRRRAAAAPLGFGFVLLVLAVAAKFTAPLVWNVGAVQIFTMPDVFYLAVLGWCAHFANGRDRLMVLGFAAILFPVLAYTGGNWTGSWVKFSMQLAAVAILLYWPKLRVPGSSARLVLPIAAASYHIYLFHRVLPDLLLPPPDPSALDWVAALVAVVGGVAVGIAAFALQGAGLGWLAGRRFAPAGELAPQRA
jgi:acyl-CoA synthetase (AMP-forming)/AMP-acid ligase II